ncbi:NXPE family member 3-like [Amphiura filiformis]|uniref:NXPE family member 3-like n=1 Tax=Amphiura filiformis TaxID=82378 RepID=UPI003B21397C
MKTFQRGHDQIGDRHLVKLIGLMIFALLSYSLLIHLSYKVFNSNLAIDTRFANQSLRGFAPPAIAYRHHGGKYKTTAPQIATKSPDIRKVNISLDFPTSPKFSYYFVKSNKPYNLCDTLEVSIEARNTKNESKLYGGDFFFAWIHNDVLHASAAADEIIDHFNGTYTAKFRLHWTGQVKITIVLTHSAEAIDVLKRIRDTLPPRGIYRGIFQPEGHTPSISTPCHITTDMYINPKDKFANMTFCNFTDEKTGFPWFCVKPKLLSCDTYFIHTSIGDKESLGDLISEKEVRLITSPEVVTSFASPIDVVPSNNSVVSKCVAKDLEACVSRATETKPNESAAGFYFKDVWHSLVCHNREFTPPEIRKCLKNKAYPYYRGKYVSCQSDNVRLPEITKCLQNHTLYFLGDSTIRQWYEHFARFILKDTIVEKRAARSGFGPNVARDEVHDIHLKYLFNGYPIIQNKVFVKDIKYIPNTIDEIVHENRVVVLITIWAHFELTNLTYYRNRLHKIRDSIQRLKSRIPSARVLIKSANTHGSASRNAAQWYIWNLDQVMREVMSGIENVTIIDVWDMTIGHYSGYSRYKIHPNVDVIAQEIDMVLSFLCS